MRFWTGVVLPNVIFGEVQRIQSEISKKYKTYHCIREGIGPHFTLTFQPDVDEKKIAKMESIIEKISSKTKPFDVEIRGVGRFYNTNTVYLRVIKSRSIKKIQERLALGQRNFGKIRLLRPIFTLHVSIARNDISREDLNSAFKELKTRNLNYKFNIEKIYLAKSEPGERTKVYKTIKLK
jgi:2'-5' RNA ligase